MLAKGNDGDGIAWYGSIHLTPVSFGVAKASRMRGCRTVSPCIRLSFVGCNGCAPFPSMIVEWNPQTVKRRPGKPLDVVLDTGLCIGGIYKAA